MALPSPPPPVSFPFSADRVEEEDDDDRHDESFRRIVLHRLARKFRSSGFGHESVSSLCQRVVKDAADVVGVRYVYCGDDCVPGSCIQLEEGLLDALEDLWNGLLRASDHRGLSHADRSIHERIHSSHAQRVDLVRYLGVLFRRSSVPGRSNERRSETLLKTKRLNLLLAVDGFGGLLPHDFRNYVDNLRVHRAPNRLRNLHVRAVRRLYDAFDERGHDAVTGTGAACLVFLALLEVFEGALGVRADEEIRHCVDRSRSIVGMFLQKVSTHHGDEVRLLRDGFVREVLAPLYAAGGWEPADLERVAHEKLGGLVKSLPLK